MEKESHLRKPSDFIKTFKGGERFISPYFVLYARKNDLGVSRLGVSISKSHFKLATRRNRIRRIAREIFRKEIAPSIKGYDLVITSRGSQANVYIKRMLEELKNLIGRTVINLRG